MAGGDSATSGEGDRLPARQEQPHSEFFPETELKQELNQNTASGELAERT